MRVNTEEGHMVSEARGDTLRGKVAVVTGANAGMGKEISLGLARLGATLVMVCRDRQRGESARSEVEDHGRFSSRNPAACHSATSLPQMPNAHDACAHLARTYWI